MDHFTEICCGNQVGSYRRLINSCITQLKAQRPSGTCNESQEEGTRTGASTAEHQNNLRTTAQQKCGAVPRRARIEGSKIVVSLNAKLESNREEGGTRTSAAIAAHAGYGSARRQKSFGCQGAYRGTSLIGNRPPPP